MFFRRQLDVFRLGLLFSVLPSLLAAQARRPQPASSGGGGLSFAPYLGINYPTQDLFRLTSGEIKKIKLGLVVGGRVGIWFSSRIGIETDVGYSPASVEIDSTGANLNQDVTIITGSAKLTVWLLPRDGVVSFALSGGVGAVRHDIKASTVNTPGGVVTTPEIKGTNVGGVAGATIGFRLGRVVALTLSAEDYLYNASFDASNVETGSRRQHDIRASLGVHLPFLGF